MANLEPIIDFPAEVIRLKTMADKSIRLELSLPETEVTAMMKMVECQQSEYYLRFVVYRNDVFIRQVALVSSRKEIRDNNPSIIVSGS